MNFLYLPKKIISTSCDRSIDSETRRLSIFISELPKLREGTMTSPKEATLSVDEIQSIIDYACTNRYVAKLSVRKLPLNVTNILLYSHPELYIPRV